MRTLSQRYQQAHKEAKYSVLLTLLYFIWWYATAYGLAPSVDAINLPELYWGLPLWFLLSCVLGPLLFIGLTALMVTFLFKDISLEIEKDDTYE